MNAGFFGGDSYFIDQKNILHNLYRCHQIYNDKRECIGLIKQKKAFRSVLGLITNKTIFPFLFEIRSANGGLEASVSRGWGLLKSKAIIQDAKGGKIGSIKKRSHFFKLKRGFKIMNASDEIIAEISGSFKTWSFVINDSSQRQIGSIDKEWAKEMKGLFRSDDKYNVNFESNYSYLNNKIAILTGAIIIDLFFSE